MPPWHHTQVTELGHLHNTEPLWGRVPLAQWLLLVHADFAPSFSPRKLTFQGVGGPCYVMCMSPHPTVVCGQYSCSLPSSDHTAAVCLVLCLPCLPGGHSMSYPPHCWRLTPYNFNWIYILANSLGFNPREQRDRRRAVCVWPGWGPGPGGGEVPVLPEG